MIGRLVGVGVGPGDPELLTIKGLRVLRESDVVLVPVADGDEEGRAESVVLAHVPRDRVRRVVFALSRDEEARRTSWAAAAETVAEALRTGGLCAFATIGDPNVYSTFSHLTRAVRGLLPDIAVETVPGITAMQELSARSGVVLATGDERLALFPFTAGPERFADALEAFEVVVCYKGGRRLPRILSTCKRVGRLDDAVYGARLGLPGQDVRPARELDGGPGPYLSTLIVAPRRDGP